MNKNDAGSLAGEIDNELYLFRANIGPCAKFQIRNIHTLYGVKTIKMYNKDMENNENLSSPFAVQKRILGAIGGDETKFYDSPYSVQIAILEQIEGGGEGRFVREAPLDGKNYVRNNGQWEELPALFEAIVVDELPEASENESWELEDGTSYDPNVFYKPSVSAKFFNKKVTFEVPMSFTEMQVKQSFSSASQLNGFISMLYNSVDKSMTIKIDSLVMRTINNMIGLTVKDEFADGTYTNTGVKAINLLKLYNTRFGTTLTADKCLTDAEFNRYAAYQIGLYIDRLTRISTLFNIGKKERFTNKNLLHLVMLSDFAKASDAYLQSEVYHNDLTSLPKHESVPYWQASGQNYSFSDVSKINIKTSENDNIEFGGILAVMFDRDALGVTNLSRRVTTNYNAKAEFYNNFYKFDAGYFNDTNENFLVFFVA